MNTRLTAQGREGDDGDEWVGYHDPFTLQFRAVPRLTCTNCGLRYPKTHVLCPYCIAFPPCPSPGEEMLPLNWRDWRFIGSVCGFLLAVVMGFVWWFLTRI